MSQWDQLGEIKDQLIETYNHGDMRLRLLLVFVITAVFSPWSLGITFFILFLIGYEVVFYYYCRWNSSEYLFIDRVALVSASYLGWLFGRWLNQETRDENITDDIHAKMTSLRDFFSKIRP